MGISTQALSLPSSLRCCLASFLAWLPGLPFFIPSFPPSLAFVPLFTETGKFRVVMRKCEDFRKEAWGEHRPQLATRRGPVAGPRSLDRKSRVYESDLLRIPDARKTPKQSLHRDRTKQLHRLSQQNAVHLEHVLGETSF